MDERSLDVNEYGVLRIPAALWLALVLQCRHWVLGLMLLLSARHSKDVWHLLTNDFGVWILLLELPSLLSLTVCTQRRAEAGYMVRFLWRCVPHMTAITCLAHLGHTAWHLWFSTYWLPWPELAMASLALIDLMILLALFKHGHWQAVWAEFPAIPSRSSRSNKA